MGQVYLAFDHLLQRPVALKLPRVASVRANWLVRARALREARALARSRHQNVVRLLDVCTDEGNVGLVLDVVPGISLRAQVLPWKRVVAIFAQIGTALASVHAAGLVHRDVSPHNILVEPDDTATLIDFGLARSWRSSGDDEDDLLALQLSSTASGTPAFMAPEQRRGAPPAPAADQYGLCATLFTCIVGEPPDGALAAGPADEWVRRMAPAELWRVIGRGLSAPDRRFADMRELTEQLSNVAATSPCP